MHCFPTDLDIDHLGSRIEQVAGRAAGRLQGARPGARTCMASAGFLILLALIRSPLLVAGESVGHLLQAGDSAFGRGEYSAAIRHYSDAVERDSNSVLLYTKRAAAHMALKQHAQALRDLDSAVELDASSTTARLHRGKLHRLVGTTTCSSDCTRVQPGCEATPS